MIFEVKVVTNSDKPGVWEQEDTVKVKVKSLPFDGKANKEVVELLAAHFKVDEKKVRIVSGEKSKKKTVEIIA